MILEVEPNENCQASAFARFKEVGPARPVIQVKTYERAAEGAWYWVTGWADDSQHPCCPAYAQQVEDSGAGLTHLVFGGIYGVRLKPVTRDEEWNLDSPHQWGEPYLSLADSRDIRYQDE
ncbi:MAG: hypothetical protein ACT4OO_10505 [Nitrospiraceae bacterium]